MGLLLIACVVISAAACGKRRADVPPALAAPKQSPSPKQNLVVLLPSESGKPSQIRVSNQGGEREVNRPYAAVRLESASEAPAGPIEMDVSEVQRNWGSIIDAVPLASVQFNLHFVLAKEDLTPESQALIPEVLRAIRERRSTDISLIGHTDTTDDDESNYRLGLRRAGRIADLLRSNGVDPASLSIESHGERNLIVKTADGVAEPGNRRVEISVR